MAEALEMPAWNAAVREVAVLEGCKEQGIDDEEAQARVLMKFIALRSVFLTPVPTLPDWKSAMIYRMQLYVLGTLIHEELSNAARRDS